MLDYFGYIIFIIFILLMLNMVNKGPFIFQRGIKHFINIKDIQFDIRELTIKQGDTVVFTNFDQFRHSIITDDTIINNSGILYEFDTYTHTFGREGIYEFASSLYPKMEKLLITVEETQKGRQFYSEIFNNLYNFIVEFIETFLFYIRMFIYKLIW